uniref:Uncharacterized protein n=1 Tax=Prymnesium polylepis TaxID=72548 RepID=A0A7S4HFR5_9EUKA|mmetsp:Transcript_71757/g.196571  ORF Transcript_71757/g.196571 Transcript_71757/m.196571 type:complete len:114 (-) Transcript_71757:1083-1424(-)
MVANRRMRVRVCTHGSSGSIALQRIAAGGAVGVRGGQHRATEQLVCSRSLLSPPPPSLSLKHAVDQEWARNAHVEARERSPNAYGGSTARRPSHKRVGQAGKQGGATGACDVA